MKRHWRERERGERKREKTCNKPRRHLRLKNLYLGYLGRLMDGRNKFLLILRERTHTDALCVCARFVCAGILYVTTLYIVEVPPHVFGYLFNIQWYKHKSCLLCTGTRVQITKTHKNSLQSWLSVCQCLCIVSL